MIVDLPYWLFGFHAQIGRAVEWNFDFMNLVFYERACKPCALELCSVYSSVMEFLYFGNKYFRPRNLRVETNGLEDLMILPLRATSCSWFLSWWSLSSGFFKLFDFISGFIYCHWIFFMATINLLSHLFMVPWIIIHTWWLFIRFYQNLHCWSMSVQINVIYKKVITWSFNICQVVLKF